MRAKNRIELILGDTYPLARHIVQLTAVFVLLLLSIYIVRSLIFLLFPPGEFLTQLLHGIDTYAALLGIIGYVVWLTLDMVSLIIGRGKKAMKKGGAKNAKVDKGK